MTTISIVIPAYNAEKFIGDAVDSALAQTYRNREVIVIDDGSDDGTLEILRQYRERIRVITQENQGTANACNAGVAAATGEWIAFLDADDQWLPRKLETQLRFCSNFKISHTDSICFGEGLQREVLRSDFEMMRSGPVLEHLLIGNFITKSTVLVSRDVYRSFGGFSERYDAVEDWPLWLQICAKHNLGYVAEALTRYRVHAQSKSMRARVTDAAHLKIITDAFGPEGVGREHQNLKSKAISKSSEINAHYAASTGDWKWAVRCASRAIFNGTREPRIWKILAKSLAIPLGVRY